MANVLWLQGGACSGKRIFNDLTSGRTQLDIFVFEGTVIQGPHGTGRFTCSPTGR